MDKCSPHEVMVKSVKKYEMLTTALPIITLLVYQQGVSLLIFIIPRCITMAARRPTEWTR